MKSEKDDLNRQLYGVIFILFAIVVILLILIN